MREPTHVREMGEISRNFHGNLVIAMEILCWKSPLGRPEIYAEAKAEDGNFVGAGRVPSFTVSS